VNFTRLFDLIYFQRERYSSSKSFNQRILGRWENRSTHQFIEQVEKLAFGLIAAELKKGDKIGIFTSYGSTDWFVIDIAAMMIGLTTTPINTNYTDEELKYLINESRLDYCFVNEDLLADKLQEVGFPKDKLISFGNSIRHLSWNDLISKGANIHIDNLARRKEEVHPDDLATIIYTSGSTGLPKGVMLSHANVVSNIKSIIPLLPVNYKHKVASFLPLSHIFERMVIYTYIAVGAQIYFIQNPKELVKNLQNIKPDYITSVPRILEKVYNEINLRMKKKNKLIRSIVNYAINLGEKEVDGAFHKIKKSVTLKFVDFFVYRRWRNILGGNLKGVIVGAAAMPSHIARLYSTAGVPVKEGYGLTETSPVVSFNRFEPGGTKFASVGIPIPGVQVKIDYLENEDIGEILVKGPNVMLGYYNKPELTKERISEDGWFRTGDIGYFQDRFLYVSDRKKNIIKTSSGQYVFLQKIEEKLRAHESIDQAMVIGFQRSFLSTLIIPDYKQLKKWCLDKGIHWTAELYMIENDRVKKYFDDIILKINESLKNHEKIKAYTLLAEEWSVDSEEYTPTLKFRRKFIIEKYSKVIDDMYS
jgi:long-chain acyl-CoA synthetase